MKKSLFRFLKISFIFFTVQILAIVSIAILWIYNFFGIRGIPLISEYIFLGSVIFFAADITFFWFAIASLNRKRQSNDIEAASLLGGDLQAAYNFDQIGLIAIDNSNVVIWSNSLFKERQMNLVDSDIFEFLPDLKQLIHAPMGKAISVEIKGRFYEVHFLADPRLFVFKDTTEYVNVVNYSKEQAIALGIIMIDNYNDVASDTDELADSIMRVRSLIIDYCRQFKVLLRRVKQDTYFMVCNYRSLANMEQDSFSILEKVRAAEANEATPLTLSIGFAHDFPDASKLNDMADNAIDVALSRGGDQAVVSQYGKELKFFGGKSVAVENTSKIKVRSAADSLCALIKSSSNVFIMGHTDMDMDALGSALGVLSICEWCDKKNAKIVYSPKKSEKKARLAFQSSFSKDALEKMTITPEQAVSQIKESTLVIVVDVSVPRNVMAPKLLDLSSKTIVIDHHRRGEEFIERPVFAYIEPSASSASELVAEMIRYATANPRIEVKPSFATIMLSGIFMDSNFFKSKSVGMRTFEAAEILKAFGADNAMADEFLKDDFEEYALVNKIISSMKTPYFGVVYCVSDDDVVVERSTLAKVANQLLQLKDIHACFVIGRVSDNKIWISARSDGSISVQLLMEKMQGGGHLQMAATSFDDVGVEEAKVKLLETLSDYLDQSKIIVAGGGNN